MSKIIHFSDLHGDIDALRAVQYYTCEVMEEGLDAIVCSGDLIDCCFNKKEKEIYMQICDNLDLYQKKNNKEEYLSDSAEFILDNPKAPDSLKKNAELYLTFLECAEKASKAQYEIIKEEFDKFELPVFLVPGNYDTRSIEEVFKDENIHKKTVKSRGLNFTGYGGANVSPAHTPKELIYPVKEIIDDEKIYSEPYNFLSKTETDILVAHMPPLGILDKVKAENSRVESQNKDSYTGSLGIRAYIEEYNPKLVLCGHIHENMDVAEDKGTTILNAGSISSKKGRSENNFSMITFLKDRISHIDFFAGYYEKDNYYVEKIEQVPFLEEEIKNSVIRCIDKNKSKEKSYSKVL